MIKSDDWMKFVLSITTDRPWVDNEATKEIARLVAQEDIARVVYSLFGAGSVSFLTESNRDLNMNSPLDLIKSEDGGDLIRQFLMSNPWL
ncbi:antitoxin Xre/MbcA/ParS toxin-binding domain-containing protein [Dyella tabacisoli]|uniref:DUF2384 domain-containing protein n=1 Tax=Dyella tabacisoli TaxID=2282381 RepID=A0A369UQD8_9GAMM|nr:antitoxin Xre/MbcA/ParS toxin-binding domain-containing protein [Dyella tabacisoli]RDD82265.1 DUF2384 domain-containing protein [Dyella tabacisoli]